MRNLKVFLLLLFLLTSPIKAKEETAIFIPFYDYIEKTTLEGHSSAVLSVAFSPDGRMLASGSEDGTIKLWDVESRELLETIEGHSSAVLSVAFSSDGRMLASGSEDGTIRLWDVESRELLATIEGYDGGVLSVAFSPEGNILAFGSDGEIKLWDVEIAGLLYTIKVHFVDAHLVAFGSEGGILAFANRGEIKLLDMKNGELLKTLKGHFGNVLSMTFSSDGKILASVSEDNAINLWDIESGKLLKTLEGHSGGVLSVAFSPDGKILALGSDDGTIKLWGGKLPLEMYETRDEILELEKEIDKLEKERESKIAELYTPKDEFETMEEYEERIAKAIDTECSLRREYSQKIKEIRKKKRQAIKEAQLKLVPYEASVVLKKYDADKGGFYAVVEGYEVFIPVERSLARVIAQHRDKSPENLIVKGSLRFVDMEKCQLVDAFLTVKGTDIAVPFGIRTDTKQVYNE